MWPRRPSALNPPLPTAAEAQKTGANFSHQLFTLSALHAGAGAFFSAGAGQTPSLRFFLAVFEMNARMDLKLWHATTKLNEKKRSGRRKHCALAIVTRSQKISPRRRPPSRRRSTAKI